MNKVAGQLATNQYVDVGYMSLIGCIFSIGSVLAAELKWGTIILTLNAVCVSYVA